MVLPEWAELEKVNRGWGNNGGVCIVFRSCLSHVKEGIFLFACNP